MADCYVLLTYVNAYCNSYEGALTTPKLIEIIEKLHCSVERENLSVSTMIQYPVQAPGQGRYLVLDTKTRQNIPSKQSQIPSSVTSC